MYKYTNYTTSLYIRKCPQSSFRMAVCGVLRDSSLFSLPVSLCSLGRFTVTAYAILRVRREHAAEHADFSLRTCAPCNCAIALAALSFSAVSVSSER
jgi:hypothetical protein